jgi:hypothetical protein
MHVINCNFLEAKGTRSYDWRQDIVICCEIVCLRVGTFAFPVWQVPHKAL